MKNHSIVTVLERMNIRLFFLFFFLFQVLLIFQGFELSDEGFFVTFYQQIYRNPETVQYNFMFWLSGIIGGAWDYVFGGLGLWGMRLASVFVATGTGILTYNLLKNYFNRGAIKLGLILVILFINNNAKALQYNNLSILFYLILLTLLFDGLRDNKTYKLFFCGLLIALNTFIRLPNVLGMGLIVVILYNGFLRGVQLKKQLQQSLMMIAGFAAGGVLVLLTMKVLGHLDIFLNAVKVVYRMGQGGKDSVYGVDKMIRSYYLPYVESLSYTIFVVAVFLFPTWLEIMFGGKFRWMKRAADFLRFAILAVLIVSVIRVREYPLVALYLMTGLSLIGGFLLLFSKMNRDQKLLTFIGGFLLVVYPFGSSAGLYIVGIYSVWIIIPIVVDYVCSINSLDTRLVVDYRNGSEPYHFPVDAVQFGKARGFVIFFVFYCCLYFTYYYPFFDKEPRRKMIYPIHNKFLHGIYTTKERASIVNGLLEASAKYIQKGDYVLAYDCIPMFHYLTETRPYIRNSFPVQYVSDIFKTELDLAVSRNPKLPVVVMQNIKTTGNGSHWPVYPLTKDPEWFERNKTRNGLMDDFLVKYNYKEVWNNGVFRILIPGTEVAVP